MITAATVASQRPVLTFDEPTHTYELRHPDGPVEALPSVTTILRAVGLINFDGVPEKVLVAARERGRRCHKAAQFLTEGTLDWDTVDPDERGYVEAAGRFLADAQFDVLAQERRLYHAAHRVAGTCDLLGWWQGKPAVGDWKTGDPDVVAARYQLAFYASMLRAMPPLEWIDMAPSTPIQRVSIRLHKDGRYSADVYRDPTDHQVALAALTVYRAIVAKGRA